MPMRTSEAMWEGSLTEGRGTIKLARGQYEMECAFTHGSRVEDGKGTNPEELIAAAHASCFSLALARVLTQAGHPPVRLHTKSSVLLTRAGAGSEIPRIELQADAVVPGIDQNKFHTYVEEAKANCPVSKLLRGAHIAVNAMLLETAE